MPTPPTTAEKIDRLNRIARLKEEGFSNQEISDKLGLHLQTVQRYIKNLDEVSIGDLSSEVIAIKRNEIEEKLRTLAEQATKVWENCLDDQGNLLDPKKWTMARAFHLRAEEVWGRIMKLYGLDNIKVENYTQVNNQQVNNYTPTNNLSDEAKNKIADIWVQEHQKKLSSNNGL